MKGYWLALALLAVLVTMISCNKKVFSFPTSSMEPTIMQGEKIAAEMKRFQPIRGELVIFEHKNDFEPRTVLLIKRVIGVGGDTVEGRNLQIFVNGKLLDEPYVEHIGKHPSTFKSLETFEAVSVPGNKIFVAGDNRDFSLDSRDSSFGLVSVDDIKGRPTEILDSPNPQRVHTSLK